MHFLLQTDALVRYSIPTMKKFDVQGLCGDFQKDVRELNLFYAEACQSLESHQQRARRESTLAEIVFHRAYVFIEVFVSDYFIGCINRQCSRYQSFRRSAILQSVQAKFSVWDSSHVQYSPPQNMSVSQVAALLDRDDLNLVFSDYAAMEQRASEWFAPVYSDKVAGVTADRKRILDVAKKIRNCIAHQSVDSFKEMNQTILALPQNGSASLLRRSVNSISAVGAYLKAAQPGIESRVQFLLNEFDAFAAQLT